MAAASTQREDGFVLRGFAAWIKQEHCCMETGTVALLKPFFSHPLRV